jgi:excisionase family DNA binding protein
MIAIHEVEAAHVPTEQIEALREFASALSTSELRDLLLGLTSHVDRGIDVALLETDSELTPSQVANRLKMSRTHLYKLLDSGALPSSRVGRDRRVRFADVIEFERQRQADRRELAERFARPDVTRAGAIDELLNDM